MTWRCAVIALASGIGACTQQPSTSLVGSVAVAPVVVAPKVRHIADYLFVPAVKNAAEGDFRAMCDGSMLKSKPANPKKCAEDARRGQMVWQACLYDLKKRDGGLVSDADVDACIKTFAPF